MANVLTGRGTRKRSFSLCRVRTRKENSHLEGSQALTGGEPAGNFECFIFRLLVALVLTELITWFVDGAHLV